MLEKKFVYSGGQKNKQLLRKQFSSGDNKNKIKKTLKKVFELMLK